MSIRFPQHVIDEIRDRADIVDIISHYVPLKKAGSGFKALCPFHSEKTPSFNVSPPKQIYHCFGCGKGGNVFSFVMEYEKVPFPEAVQLVAEKIGYTVPKEVLQRVDGEAPQKQALYKLNAHVAKLYHQRLLAKEGEPARKYLHDRGINDESISSFRLGLAPEGWDWLVNQSKRPESLPLMAAVGLILPRKEGQGYYDRFRGRLIFPIFDGQGRVVGFGGRSLDGSEPKYLNSPDSALFSKTNNLYGLHAAKNDAAKKGVILVMEGYTDVIMAHQAGHANAVATLGTALTEQHVRILKRYVDNVVMVFDSDEAGQKASHRGIDLALRGEMNVRIAVLPQGKDPCEFIQAAGAEAFAPVIDQAKDLFDYKIGIGRSRPDFAAVDGKAAVIDDILASVANFTWRNRPKQELLLTRLSREFGVSEISVRDRLNKIAARVRPEGGGQARKGAPRKRTRQLGDWVVELMLASPRYARLAADAEIMEHLEGPYRAIAEAIFAAAGMGEGETDLAAVYSRLQDEETTDLLARISSEMPEKIDCETLYRDIAAYARKHKASSEIMLETERLGRLEERTEEKEADYLRKIMMLKKQSQSNDRADKS